VSYHGGFLSLSSLSGLQALRIDPKYWQRLRRKTNRPKPSAPVRELTIANRHGGMQ
jgi:hypothetical protein